MPCCLTPAYTVRLVSISCVLRPTHVISFVRTELETNELLLSFIWMANGNASENTMAKVCFTETNHWRQHKYNSHMNEGPNIFKHLQSTQHVLIYNSSSLCISAGDEPKVLPKHQKNQKRRNNEGIFHSRLLPPTTLFNALKAYVRGAHEFTTENTQ